ncbi:MAG: SDR family oxidoreductase [Aurantimicrobium sp.]|nr:SDR family oxidoreductase [Aurantimicrobium sp.]
MSGRLKGKSVLVTGAGSGMGRVISIACAAEGAQVTAVDMNVDSATATSDEIVKAGGKAISVAGNVTQRSDVAAAVAASVEAFGKLDVMFNIAGMIKPAHFMDTTEENFRNTLDVNALGTLITQQEAAKQMIKQGHGGKLILVSSIAGRQGYPDFSAYCASKFAVNALNQSAAHSLAQHKITSNAFAPGVVDTPLWKQLDLDLVAIGSSEKPGEAYEAFSGANLIGRKGVSEDVIGTALFLASSDSDYMTGQIIMIDGGMVLV